ncbi:MAG: alanine racemase [Syntrophales bacterium]|jgi:alanine racemase
MNNQELKYRSWVEVDLDHFTKNWSEMKRLVGPDVQIMQVVKADAYGHGAIEISNMALKNGASSLGVANADEGIQLRVSEIMAPIMILSPSTISEINQIVKYDLIPSVSSLDFAGELQKHCHKAGVQVPIHIEVDTGMGRGGMMHEEAFDMIAAILGFPNIVVQGLFTHFASSEVLVEYTDHQGDLFRKLLDKLDENNILIPIRHMSNSGAILNYPKYHMNMVRPGLMSYGIYPSPETRTRAVLYPVMSFKTAVVLVKEFPEGYGIGYGRSYVTNRKTRVATIPIGYGDGYGVILSNQGEVLIQGKRCPIIGRVSMDMCTVDVSDLPGCDIGEEAVLLGRQGDEEITADEIAVRVGTISYEILCALGKRAPRVFLNKGRMDRVEPRLRRVFIPDEERSIERIDNIIRHCFQTRARNEELGNAIYYEMFETLFGKEDRQLELRANFRYDIHVTEQPPEEIPTAGKGDYFQVTTHVEYIKTIREPVFLIGCAQDNEQLAAFFEDRRCEYRWLLSKSDNLVMERDFRVNRVRIDEEDIPIIRTENTKRGYEVWCGGDQLRNKLNRPVKVQIEIVTKKSKRSNIFSVYVVYPTRGLEIVFHYAGSGMKRVREVSYFAGRHPYPEVIRKPGKEILLRVNDDDWIFPNSGVTFIWDI